MTYFIFFLDSRFRNAFGSHVIFFPKIHSTFALADMLRLTTANALMYVDTCGAKLGRQLVHWCDAVKF